MSVEKIRVAVAGACGRMGRETCKAISGADDMELVGACDVSLVGSSLADLVEGVPDVRVVDDLEAVIADAKPDVIVDFTTPAVVLDNIRKAVRGATPIVVGATGVGPKDVVAEDERARNAGTGILIVPNFAIGAVLMMKFAQEAAKFLPGVEIIELHHDRKLDAPSGTALITASMIAESRGETASSQPQPDARGAEYKGVRIHSVRLPGLVAHQEVIFGGVGQTLTIRHDSLDRTSFMPGVLLAVRKAKDIRGLVYGLDKIL
jgi:4-hydroxy-tetrahydrodipicolinate reductase